MTRDEALVMRACEILYNLRSDAKIGNRKWRIDLYL